MFCRSFWLILHLLVEACCRVATTKISKFNALPLVPVSLAFQHNSPLRPKKQGYERFTYFQHCKKTGQTYHWAHFLSKRMGCPLTAIEKNAGKWQRKRFLQNGAFFGGHKVQACKQNSHSEKDKNRTSGLSIPPYKMWGLWNELVDAYGPTIL